MPDFSIQPGFRQTGSSSGCRQGTKGRNPSATIAVVLAPLPARLAMGEKSPGGYRCHTAQLVCQAPQGGALPSQLPPPCSSELTDLRTCALILLCDGEVRTVCSQETAIRVCTKPGGGKYHRVGEKFEGHTLVEWSLPALPSAEAEVASCTWGTQVVRGLRAPLGRCEGHQHFPGSSMEHDICTRARGVKANPTMRLCLLHTRFPHHRKAFNDDEWGQLLVAKATQVPTAPKSSAVSIYLL